MVPAISMRPKRSITAPAVRRDFISTFSPGHPTLADASGFHPGHGDEWNTSSDIERATVTVSESYARLSMCPNFVGKLRLRLLFPPKNEEIEQLAIPFAVQRYVER